MYCIWLAEALGQEWNEWFAPLHIQHLAGGGAVLTGPLPDQSALHGIFARIRDLNLTIVALVRLPPAPTEPTTGKRM